MAHRELLSPLPGIFYRRANPEAEPFFGEGDHVKVGDTVGLVEAMKQFSEITAEFAGTVVRFNVENEDAVEAGQSVVTLDC